MSQTHPGFHHRISKTDAKYQPAANRYVLYAALSCPYVHRTLISYALKGLKDVVQIVYTSTVYSVNDFEKNTKGWMFGNPENVLPPDEVFAKILREFDAKSEEDKATILAIDELKAFYQNLDIRQTTTSCGVDTTDPLFNAKSVKEIYNKLDPTYDGRFTVPFLYDKETNSIVNNESIEICEIFDSAFDEFATTPSWNAFKTGESDEEQQVIDAELAKINSTLITAPYAAAFATDQYKFYQGTKLVSETLNGINDKLQNQRFLAGKKFSKVDICALVSLLRLNTLTTLFHVSPKRLQDFPNIFAYVRDIWQNVFNDAARNAWKERLSATTVTFSFNVPANAKLPPADPIDFTAPVDRANL